MYISIEQDWWGNKVCVDSGEGGRRMRAERTPTVLQRNQRLHQSSSVVSLSKLCHGNHRQTMIVFSIWKRNTFIICRYISFRDSVANYIIFIIARSFIHWAHQALIDIISVFVMKTALHPPPHTFLPLQ